MAEVVVIVGGLRSIWWKWLLEEVVVAWYAFRG